MTDTSDTDRLTRRRMIAAATSAGAFALAGCSTGGDGGDGGGGGDSGDGGGGGDSGDGGGGNNTTTTSYSELEVAHWWSEGDGNEAINALMEGFRQQHPDVPINSNMVAGGAGQALRQNIRTRIQNGNPPSTFQTWPGKELQPFVEADLLESLDDIWSRNSMQDAYLQGPKDAARFDGTFVTVPLNIHRLNNLFYNVEVVESAGVDPSSVSSPEGLLDVMSTIQSETDAAPMANQTNAPWSTLQMWAQVLLGQAGVDTYMSFTEGNVTANEEAIRTSLQTVADYSEYFNEDAGSISWTTANQKIMNGEAAFIHQGDWAAGAYRGQDGFEYETHWNHVPFPGTEGMYALNMDSFPMPVNNPSPEATRLFLEYVGTVDAQERFNPLKGSIPPRTDVPDDEFGPFLTNQKADFANSSAQPPSITHGLGVPPETLSNLKNAMSRFTSDWDVDGMYSRIQSAF